MRFVIPVAMSATLACGATEGGLPPGVQDPDAIKTRGGALAFYRGIVTEVLPKLVNEPVTIGAVLSDELMATPMPLGFSANFYGVDSRSNAVPFGFDAYKHLHQIRAQAREARGFLGAYASDSASALIGHLYAIEGYAEVVLADLFCSGIPLSTVDFGGDFTFAAGSTTEEVYTHASTFFDSALALVGDSARLQHLASIGQGRALLALGDYTAAAAAVGGVPDDYSYQVIFNEQPPTYHFLSHLTHPGGVPTVGDREGGNGLDYRSSNDPRTTAFLLGKDDLDNHVYYPAKYPTNGVIPFVLASGIEARLIEAEAALKAGAADHRWLDLLNHLRQTAWATITPAVSGPLPDLVDPGLDDAGQNALRVDLLFRERAFWLYLTGHRVADLRRLVRQYQRAPTSVYPAGAYPGGLGRYGSQLVFTPPAVGVQLNPNYTGCYHQNA